jgi:acyl-CoA thioester hydrolase
MKAQLLELRIDWGELDLLGHVNNVSIVRYCQAARILFLESVGLHLFPKMDFGPIEAATSLQFLRQLHFPGTVKIYTTLQEIKHTSFVLEHRIYGNSDELAVLCTEVIVCFDFKAQTKVAIPPHIRQNMDAYVAGFTAERPTEK